MTESKMPFLYRRFGKGYPWFVCFLGAIFYCYEYYLRITPSVMTQELMRAFSISGLALGNLAAFYYYAYTPMQLFVGVLLDRYGPRRLLVLACFACAIGTYFFTSHNLQVAHIGRFLIGFGSAFAFVGALKLATIWLPPERLGMISGLALMLGMAGAIGGDISLTYFVKCFGWKQTILFTGAFGLVFTVILALVIRDTGPNAEAFEETQQSSILEGLKGLVSLLKKKNIWLNGIYGCLLYLSLSLFAELWGPRFLESVYNFSKEEAAWGTSMVFFGWALGGPISGSLSDFFRRRRLPMMIGSLIGALITAYLIFVPHDSKVMVFALMFLSGLFCSSQVLVFPLAVEFSPSKTTGTALALTNMFVMIGGVFQPLIGEILDITWDGTMANGVPVYAAGDFRIALAILPACFLLGFIVTCFIPETRCRHLETKEAVQVRH